MKFIPKTIDYDLSPYTGLTRESWIEAAEYVIDGIFKNTLNGPALWNLLVESMQYVLHDETGNYDSFANVTYWIGKREDVLYRRQFFDYRISEETH